MTERQLEHVKRIANSPIYTWFIGELDREAIRSSVAEIERLAAERDALLLWMIKHDSSGYWIYRIPSSVHGSAPGGSFHTYSEAAKACLEYVTNNEPEEKGG